MRFCESCFKMFEGEADICPHCGAAVTPQTDTPLGEAADSGAYQAGEPPFAPAQDNLQDKVSEISRIMNENAANNERRDAYNNAPQNYEIQETVTPGEKAALIILSIMIPIAGIVVGIIYLSKPDPSKKSIGKVALIISVAIMALGMICGCIGGLLAVNRLEYF